MQRWLSSVYRRLDGLGLHDGLQRHGDRHLSHQLQVRGLSVADFSRTAGSRALGDCQRSQGDGFVISSSTSNGNEAELSQSFIGRSAARRGGLYRAEGAMAVTFVCRPSLTDLDSMRAREDYEQWSRNKNPTSR